METPTLRGYVWVFCMYLACTVDQIAHTGGAIGPSHLERSLFTLFTDVGAPLLAILIVLSFFPAYRNGLIRTVLFLSAFTFVCQAIFALHHYEYIAFGIPHWLSGWSWFIATCLLGYRTDQLLKQNSREIEAN